MNTILPRVLVLLFTCLLFTQCKKDVTESLSDELENHSGGQYTTLPINSQEFIASNYPNQTYTTTKGKVNNKSRYISNLSEA